jgi:uncharacterized membrane protein (UPF0127 family)
MRIAVAMLLLVACTGGGTPPAGAVASEVASASDALVPAVTFPDGHVVRVEIAADNELRAQGLMYRDQLRPGAGMLFFFPGDGEYSFWMKNTRIPLDIIWIDSDRRVVDAKFDVPPCRVDDCPSYAPDGRARYVLEVAGGEARKHGLKKGDQLQFANTDQVVAR